MADIDDGCKSERDGVHVYQHLETHSGCTVVVGRCGCGKVSVAWHHGPPQEHDRHPAEKCDACMAHVVPS